MTSAAVPLVLPPSVQDDLLSVVRGFRNGVLYGAKVRAPHALVMTFLFGSGTVVEKVRAVVEATYTHSKNLGAFVALFKALCVVVRRARSHEKNDGLTTFVAGAAAGWVVWGDQNPVKSQINMYILSRIIWGTVNTALRHQWVQPVEGGYALYAAFCWGVVMYLFHHQKNTLQSSLCRSMKYLYLDSNRWPNDATSVVDWFWRAP